MIEKFKQHWFISLLLLCSGVAAATWKIAHELLVAPREYQIAQLKEELQELKSSSGAVEGVPTTEELALIVLEQTGVFENASVTTRDGRCNIGIARVSGDQVTLSVAIDAQPARTFERQRVGSRVPVDAGDSIYYIDLHRVRGNIVDLSAVRARK